jgi:peroxiredoxin Q/BCP
MRLHYKHFSEVHSMARLEQWNKAPGFNLPDQSGRQIDLDAFRGKKLLLYFYPKALTSGCTMQAQEVSAAREELERAGVEAVGISQDTQSVLKKFDERHELNFPLLSDADHSVAEAYGVWGEKNMSGRMSFCIIRSSFLIDEHGKVMKAWYKVSPKDTVPLAMRELEGYRQQK